jgi:hypothetical protein
MAPLEEPLEELEKFLERGEEFVWFIRSSLAKEPGVRFAWNRHLIWSRMDANETKQLYRYSIACS